MIDKLTAVMVLLVYGIYCVQASLFEPNQELETSSTAYLQLDTVPLVLSYLDPISVLSAAQSCKDWLARAEPYRTQSLALLKFLPVDIRSNLRGRDIPTAAYFKIFFSEPFSLLALNRQALGLLPKTYSSQLACLGHTTAIAACCEAFTTHAFSMRYTEPSRLTFWRNHLDTLFAVVTQNPEKFPALVFIQIVVAHFDYAALPEIPPSTQDTATPSPTKGGLLNEGVLKQLDHLLMTKPPLPAPHLSRLTIFKTSLLDKNPLLLVAFLKDVLAPTSTWPDVVKQHILVHLARNIYLEDMVDSSREPTLFTLIDHWTNHPNPLDYDAYVAQVRRTILTIKEHLLKEPRLEERLWKILTDGLKHPNPNIKAFAQLTQYRQFCAAPHTPLEAKWEKLTLSLTEASEHHKTWLLKTFFESTLLFSSDTLDPDDRQNMHILTEANQLKMREYIKSLLEHDCPTVHRTIFRLIPRILSEAPLHLCQSILPTSFHPGSPTAHEEVIDLMLKHPDPSLFTYGLQLRLTKLLRKEIQNFAEHNSASLSLLDQWMHLNQQFKGPDPNIIAALKLLEPPTDLTQGPHVLP